MDEPKKKNGQPDDLMVPVNGVAQVLIDTLKAAGFSNYFLVACPAPVERDGHMETFAWVRGESTTGALANLIAYILQKCSPEDLRNVFRIIHGHPYIAQSLAGQVATQPESEGKKPWVN